MATLTIASKANQATSVPALLVAAWANELDPNASVRVEFQDAETLKSRKSEVVELALGSEGPTYGSGNVIDSLLHSFFLLQGTDESLVSRPYTVWSRAVLIYVDQGMAPPHICNLPYRIQAGRASPYAA